MVFKNDIGESIDLGKGRRYKYRGQKVKYLGANEYNVFDPMVRVQMPDGSEALVDKRSLQRCATE